MQPLTYTVHVYNIPPKACIQRVSALAMQGKCYPQLPMVFMWLRRLSKNCWGNRRTAVCLSVRFLARRDHEIFSKKNLFAIGNGFNNRFERMCA
jgi:hypothetical protein